MTAGDAGGSLRLTRVFSAPPEEVFEAWTDPEQVTEWLCPGEGVVAKARLDLRVGGRFRIVMRIDDKDWVHTGEYREIDFPRRLVFTWISEATDHHESVVTVELRDKGEKTEMTLIHEGLPGRDAEDRHRSGWTSIFGRLERHIR